MNTKQQDYRSLIGQVCRIDDGAHEYGGARVLVQHVDVGERIGRPLAIVLLTEGSERGTRLSIDADGLRPLHFLEPENETSPPVKI